MTGVFPLVQLLAMKEADRHGSCIILATDPDADRLAVAERDQSSGHWRIFTGNEVGTLLGWWAFTTYKERRPHFDGECVSVLKRRFLLRIHLHPSSHKFIVRAELQPFCSSYILNIHQERLYLMTVGIVTICSALEQGAKYICWLAQSPRNY